MTASRRFGSCWLDVDAPDELVMELSGMGMGLVGGDRFVPSGILGSRDSAGGFPTSGGQGEGPRLSPPGAEVGGVELASGGIMGHASSRLDGDSGEGSCEM